MVKLLKGMEEKRKTTICFYMKQKKMASALGRRQSWKKAMKLQQYHSCLKNNTD